MANLFDDTESPVTPTPTKLNWGEALMGILGTVLTKDPTLLYKMQAYKENAAMDEYKRQYYQRLMEQMALKEQPVEKWTEKKPIFGKQPAIDEGTSEEVIRKTGEREIPSLFTPPSVAPNVIATLKARETPMTKGTWHKGEGGKLFFAPSEIPEGTEPVIPKTTIPGEAKEPKKPNINIHYTPPDKFGKIYKIERNLDTGEETVNEIKGYQGETVEEKQARAKELKETKPPKEPSEEPKSTTDKMLRDELSRWYLNNSQVWPGGITPSVEKMDEVYPRLQPYQRRAFDKIIGIAHKNVKQHGVSDSLAIAIKESGAKTTETRIEKSPEMEKSRRDALDAIKQGADKKLVNERFKQKWGINLE